MKAVVAAFNQEKALVGAFSVITNLRMELFEALLLSGGSVDIVLTSPDLQAGEVSVRLGQVTRPRPKQETEAMSERSRGRCNHRFR